jgi:hypothetical protein
VWALKCTWDHSFLLLKALCIPITWNICSPFHGTQVPWDLPAVDLISGTWPLSLIVHLLGTFLWWPVCTILSSFLWVPARYYSLYLELFSFLIYLTNSCSPFELQHPFLQEPCLMSSNHALPFWAFISPFLDFIFALWKSLPLCHPHHMVASYWAGESVWFISVISKPRYQFTWERPCPLSFPLLFSIHGWRS